MVTREPHRRVIGTFEKVNFPEYGGGLVVAKIDTGAYTGALHCERIEERQVEGGKVLVFEPLDGGMEITKDDFVIKYVKSSNGKRQKRYFVTTEIELLGETHVISLSLTDRSDMRWPVLIGRRFLKQNHYVVDPHRNDAYREQQKAK